MRFALITLLAAVAALAQPTTQGPYPLNPPNLAPGFKGWDDLATVAKRAPITNAERFAQGLPPLKSKARRHRGGPHRDSSYLTGGTRVRSAPRAETSPVPPVTTKCNLLVTETNGTPLGYLSRNWNEYGEYGTLQQTQDDDALLVSMTYPTDSPSQLNMVAENTKSPNYPLVGGILGFSSQDDSSFGPGQYNYAYMGGSQPAPSGPPMQNMQSAYGEASGLDSDGESAIWTYNPATQDIAAQWINPDGSGPTTYMGMTSGIMLLTGDIEQTGQTLGVEITPVNLKCVSPVAPTPP